ncbi:hypothetical protein U1Q18_028212 [Sarracenia purpurea var. burkii]
MRHWLFLLIDGEATSKTRSRCAAAPVLVLIGDYRIGNRDGRICRGDRRRNPVTGGETISGGSDLGNLGYDPVEACRSAGCTNPSQRRRVKCSQSAVKPLDLLSVRKSGDASDGEDCQSDPVQSQRGVLD